MADLRGVLPYFVCYVLCYAPFCYLASQIKPPLAVLPISTCAALLGMVVVTTLAGWWRRVQLLERGRPRPALWSGLATSLILLSTPLAYALPVQAFTSSQVMKLSTLALAPLVDTLRGDPVRPASWLALTLCLGGLLLVSGGFAGVPVVWAWGVYGAYVLAYAVRFWIMAGHRGSVEFFVTEHLVTSTAALVLILVATPFSADLQLGWSWWWKGDLWVIGVLSTCVGLAGGWMLQAHREYTWTVPLNRCAAILAAFLATTYGYLWEGGRAPRDYFGAILALMVVGVLSLEQDKLKSQLKIEVAAKIPS